jgi:ribosomal protein S26
MSSKDLMIADIMKSIERFYIPNQDRQCHTFSYLMPCLINSFFGIECSFELDFTFIKNTRNYIKFRINHNDMTKNDCEMTLFYHTLYENAGEINENVVSTMLDDLLALIPQIKFDLFTGLFVLETPKAKLVFDLFKDVVAEGLVLNGDKCSVCYELVLTKTICKHNLCIPCFQQLRETKVKKEDEEKDEEEDDEDECLSKHCPTCRKPIEYTY